MEEKISPAVVIVGGLGLGLVGALGLAALAWAAAKGFRLEIINAPAGAVLWDANFAEQSFDYDPIADSGWLGIDEAWNYPSDPRGCTNLHILILDADNNVLLDVYNLGPVNVGKNYVYDCATGELIEAI